MCAELRIPMRNNNPLINPPWHDMLPEINMSAAFKVAAIVVYTHWYTGLQQKLLELITDTLWPQSTHSVHAIRPSAWYTFLYCVYTSLTVTAIISGQGLYYVVVYLYGLTSAYTYMGSHIPDSVVSFFTLLSEGVWPLVGVLVGA